MTDGGLPPPDGVKKQMKGYKFSIPFLEGALVEMCSTLSAFISDYLIGIGGHDCGFEKDFTSSVLRCLPSHYYIRKLYLRPHRSTIRLAHQPNPKCSVFIEALEAASFLLNQKRRSTNCRPKCLMAISPGLIWMLA